MKMHAQLAFLKVQAVFLLAIFICVRICMCTDTGTCECTGILNLQHPIHKIDCLKFKNQKEVIKVLLRRGFVGPCVFLPTVVVCGHHQIRSAMTV